MSKPFLFTSVALAICGGGMVYFDHIVRPAMSAKYLLAAVPPPPTVSISEARLVTEPRHLTAIGTLRAARQVTIAPEVGGRVTSLLAEAGALVHANDPLIQLNDQSEQADLAMLEAQARLATLNLARSQALIRTNATPQATLDQNKAVLEQIDANIEKIHALIDQKRIRAPFAGLLGIRRVDLGQYVNPGADLLTLTDLDRIQVNFSLPEQNRDELMIGQEVLINVDAFPGRVYKALLTAIEPQVQVETRMIKLQATAENPDHSLLPGMFASIALVLSPQAPVVVVPETSIEYSLYGDSIYIVASDDGGATMKVQRKIVRTGGRYDGMSIVTEGLTAGDNVVNSGQLRLAPGMIVKTVHDDVLQVSTQASIR